MKRAVLGIALLAGCAGTAAPPEPEEWDRELPGRWQIDDLAEEGEDGEPGDLAFAAIRVVDDATGEPIAGARIDNFWEADTPHAEPWEDLRGGTWTTDRDGWALLPSRDHAPWYFVEAPGYGPRGEMSLDDEYRIRRGVDFPLEVRDWRDRPFPGAVVEAFLGCGHTPPSGEERAGPDGRLVFRCIDITHATDLWVRTPGLAGRNDAYWGGGPEALPVEDGIAVLRVDPASVLEGLVLRPDGTPAAGARVGTRESHRGPWTVAGPDGRYRLVGAPPGWGLIAMAPYADPVPEGFMSPQVEFLSVPGVFTTVRLPAEGKRWPTQEERDAEREKFYAEREARERGEEPEPEVSAEGSGIRVRVEAVPGVTPFGRVGILLVRDGDGAAEWTAPMFRSGAAARAVAIGPGTWTVTAGDPAGLLRPQSRRVEVKDGWTEISFALEPNPAWKPRVVERAAAGTEPEAVSVDSGKFRVLSEDGDVEATPHMTDEGLFEGAIHVPEAGPFAVEFRAEDGRKARVVLDGPPTGEGPAIVLPPPEPEREWINPEVRPREFSMSTLQVLLPDGSPAPGADVQVLSVESPDPRFPGFRKGEERSVYLDETGAGGCAFDRGDRVTVSHRGEGAERFVPFVERIRGPGPWTLRWPAGEVAIRAVDGTGTPIEEFSVLTGGWDTIEAEDGCIRLRGVGTDPLRLWVAAPGRRVHDLRLVLGEGEKREVVVRMSPAVSR